MDEATTTTVITAAARSKQLTYCPISTINLLNQIWFKCIACIFVPWPMTRPFLSTQRPHLVFWYTHTHTHWVNTSTKFEHGSCCSILPSAANRRAAHRHPNVHRKLLIIIITTCYTIHIVLVVVAAVFVAAAACEWICNNEWCKFDGAGRDRETTVSNLMHAHTHTHNVNLTSFANSMRNMGRAAKRK